MILELLEEDLHSDCRNVPTSSVEFKHLTEEAQNAVTIVGSATFYRDKGSRKENYNRVYPSK
jgi:hypothetical protein